jgi:uncharacterized membrane protein YjdF
MRWKRQPWQLVNLVAILPLLIAAQMAAVFGGELGTANLGTHGNEWDSQMDKLFGVAGALVALLAMAIARRLRPWRAP